MGRSYDPQCLRLIALLKQLESQRADDLVGKLLQTHAPEWIYLHVLIPATFYSGEEYLEGRSDQATALQRIAEVRRLMRTVKAHLARRPRLGKTLFGTFLPGDVHAIGFTAALDWLERDGWDVQHVEDAKSEPQIVAAAVAAKPAVVAISCSLNRSVPMARRIIRGLRQGGVDAQVWIGGRPFVGKPDLAARIGAEFTAPDIIAFTRVLAEKWGYQTATPAELA